MSAISAQNKRHAWMAFGSVCATLIVFVGIAYNCMGIYADPVTTELGITRAQYMLLMTIAVMTNGLINLLLYGRIEEKFGLRVMMVAGGISTSLSFFLFSFAQNLTMLYVGGFFLGLGLSVQTNNTLNTAINHWFKKRMGTLVSVANTCGSVTGIIAATVIALVIGSLGWRMGFLATGIIGVVATVIIAFLYKGDPKRLGERPLWADEVGSEDAPAEEEDGVSYARMIKAPSFWVLALLYFLSGLVCYAIYGSLSLFAVDNGYPDAQGTIVSVALLACTISCIPLGWVCDKLGSKWLFVICMACIAVAAFIFQMGNLGIVSLYIAAIIAGIGYNANNIPHGVSMKEAAGSLEFSRKLGILIFFNFIGVSLGPTVLNLLYDAMGSYTVGLYAAIGAAAVVAIASFFGTKRISDK